MINEILTTFFYVLGGNSFYFLILALAILFTIFFSIIEYIE